MFKNKADTGRNNLCGKMVFLLRKHAVPKMSQRMLAEKLQLLGVDIEKNAVQRIESGQRFVTDIELRALAKVLCISCDELLREPTKSKEVLPKAEDKQ